MPERSVTPDSEHPKPSSRQSSTCRVCGRALGDLHRKGCLYWRPWPRNCVEPNKDLGEPTAVTKSRTLVLSDADQWLILEALDRMYVDPDALTGAPRALFRRIAYGDD